MGLVNYGVKSIMMSVVIPFNAIHSEFLQKRFGMDMVSSAQMITIPETISMILTPFTGTFVDRYGLRAYVSIFS